MESIVTKKCAICQQEKPVSQFYKNRTRTGKPYLNSRCKTCCVWMAQLRYDPKRRRELWCNRKEYAKEYRKSHPVKFLVAQVRNRAKRAGVECTITEQDITIPDRCPYLNIPLKMQGRLCSSSASIDRIDPSIGYIKGNIQVISVKANRMKNNATLDELLLFSRNVLALHGDIS